MVLTPVVAVVVLLLVAVVVAADTLVVDNTDCMYQLFGHIAKFDFFKTNKKYINLPDTVDNIDFVELVDELVVAEQVAEPVVAAAVVVAVDEMLVEELDVELLAVDAYMHCSCIVVFVHVSYLTAKQKKMILKIKTKRIKNKRYFTHWIGDWGNNRCW